ncbi:MarR family winged helix-turn-helix transcriptional regulator [Thiofilum flexile]|uniref:MarR family winged helix-turn-helix transcriptional regulator n=1 Tax=Thiofilum flexile TaxID=125627 RepID=UPI0003616E69|nr:MarR family transcriptional regulator [Thiofilum flexile]
MSENLVLNNLVCFNFYIGWKQIVSIYKEVLGNDVSPQKVYVLETCDPEEKITVWEVARKIGLDSSAISTMIARMEKAGLVFRTHDLEDRRQVFVQLTADGVRFRAQLREKYLELTERINRDMTGQEISILKDITSKLTTN